MVLHTNDFARLKIAFKIPWILLQHLKLACRHNKYGTYTAQLV